MDYGLMCPAIRKTPNLRVTLAFNSRMTLYIPPLYFNGPVFFFFLLIFIDLF